MKSLYSIIMDQAAVQRAQLEALASSIEVVFMAWPGIQDEILYGVQDEFIRDEGSGDIYSL